MQLSVTLSKQYISRGSCKILFQVKTCYKIFATIKDKDTIKGVQDLQLTRDGTGCCGWRRGIEGVDGGCGCPGPLSLLVSSTTGRTSLATTWPSVLVAVCSGAEDWSGGEGEK